MGVLVDEGDDFVVVLGFLVVGAVALEDSRCLSRVAAGNPGFP